MAKKKAKKATKKAAKKSTKKASKKKKKQFLKSTQLDKPLALKPRVFLYLKFVINFYMTLSD